MSETAHKIFSRKVSPQKNDIFIVKSGATTGNVGIVNTDEIFDIWSPLALVRTRSDLANQKFVYYFMLSDAFTKQIQNKWSFGTQQNIGMGVIEKIKLVVPPLDEQTQIADFLDKKVAQLDKVKSLLEEQIKTLEDYRQSLIYETVTKGLDKTVPLKDSGVDWIGQIPEGWGVGKLSQFFGEVKKKNVRNFEKNLLSLSYGRVIRKSIENLIGLLPESFETYNVIDENDIVFRLTDLQNDKKSLRTGLSKERGIITSAYITIRTTNNFINANYFNHLFYAYDLCKVYYNFGGGVRQGGTWGDLSVLRILIPPIMEQIQIADFLDKKTEQINQMIAIKKEQIENINKRRQTLIYDYVTGKRRV
ncbi:restriction endonuclease subunit S [Streptococcus suis]|nr:restriction endonuclease subunit S [Streptococcus suis]